MSALSLPLSKHHGAGNDFLVLLDADGRRPLSSTEVRLLCDRRRGIGADGVLRVMKGDATGGADHGAPQRRRWPGRDER